MRDDLQRKPSIYLLVILPILVVGGFCVVVALLGAYSGVSGVPLSNLPNLNGLLIALPGLLLWLPLSLLLGNVVLYSIPPLRRIAEEYALQADRPGFVESQKALLKILGVVALVCVPLIVLGFLV
jgi:hypothetical protein